MPHTGCLPFSGRWRCRLLTRSIVVLLPSTCKRHTGAGASCGCSRTPVHPDFQRISRNRERIGQGSSEDRTYLLQVAMAQLQMRAAQDAILLQTVTVSQTSRLVVVLMQMSKTETGLTWRSVSSSGKRLRQQCDPAMLSMLLARVSVAGVRMLMLMLVQGGLLVLVLMMILTHCFAGWQKASLQRRRQLRISMVVVVVLTADRLSVYSTWAVVQNLDLAAVSVLGTGAS